MNGRFSDSDSTNCNAVLGDYLQVLDWTALRTASGNRGATPTDAPPILERLSMSGETWCELVRNFGRLYNVAEHPRQIAAARSRTNGRWRYQ